MTVSSGTEMAVTVSRLTPFAAGSAIGTGWTVGQTGDAHWLRYRPEVDEAGELLAVIAAARADIDRHDGLLA